MSGNEARRLREFVYLDDESIDGHLSSMGVGLQTAQTQSNEDEQKSQGRFSAMVPIGISSIGGSAKASSSERNTTQDELDITVPYRFQELVRQVGSDGIKDPEDDDLDYGDVVEVQGTVTPMSLFRFELTSNAINTMGTETRRAVEAIGHEIETTEEEINATKAFLQLAESLTGDRVPVRVDTGDQSYGAVLKRSRLRVPQEHAFARERNYTLFGRVEQVIDSESEWTPIDLFQLVSTFSSQDVGIEDFYQIMKEAAREQDVTMDDAHITIEGPTKAIYPIAMYW